MILPKRTFNIPDSANYLILVGDSLEEPITLHKYYYFNKRDNNLTS